MTHSSDEGVSENPPAEWARKRVAEEVRKHDPLRGQAVYAFARYIEAHEEPPVDPLVEVLREAMPITLKDMNEPTLRLHASRIRRFLAERGIELARSEGGSDVKG